MMILVFSKAECRPCEVIKQSLNHEDVRELADVVHQPISVEALRLFRRNYGRIGLPMIVLMRESEYLAHRLGVTSLDPNIEREHILDWFKSVLEKGAAE